MACKIAILPLLRARRAMLLVTIYFDGAINERRGRAALPRENARWIEKNGCNKPVGAGTKTVDGFPMTRTFAEP
jgi:hypothetical protein